MADQWARLISEDLGSSFRSILFPSLPFVQGLGLMAGAAAPLIQTYAADGGLMSCLAIARVKPDLITYMKDVLKMETLQDFFFYVAKDAWEAELDSKVVKLAVDSSIITEAMKPIQLARVRMAWQSAAKLQDTAEAVASTAASSSEDPLPETARQMLDQRWKKRYPEFFPRSRAHGGLCDHPSFVSRVDPGSTVVRGRFAEDANSTCRSGSRGTSFRLLWGMRR